MSFDSPSIESLAQELDQRVHRLTYYSDGYSKSDWIIWLSELRAELSDLCDGLHDECGSQDRESELEAQVESLESDVRNLEREVEALKAKKSKPRKSLKELRACHALVQRQALLLQERYNRVEEPSRYHKAEYMTGMAAYLEMEIQKRSGRSA